jgi:DNA excision repair protein ERCC-4
MEVAAATSSRQGGSKRMKTVADLIRQTILVDTRELRSALPFVLYKNHLDIIPTTLSIGDYIVSRDICIERKSVTGNDLQQSLISGRLYKQLVNMTHAFAWPFLLLEFSTGKSFQLQSAETSSGEINPGSLIAQVIAILMHFPTLRIVWSPSFLFTANVFTALKVGREQPRIEQGNDQDNLGGNRNTAVFQKRAIEFLKACPGITASNLPRILKQVSSIRGLVSMKEDELIGLMGKRDGHLFLKFLDQQFK